MCTNGNNSASLRNIVPLPDETVFEEEADYPILLGSQTDTDVLIPSLSLHVISGPGARCSSNSNETAQCRVGWFFWMFFFCCCIVLWGCLGFLVYFNLQLSVPFLWSPGLVSGVRQVSVNSFGQTDPYRCQVFGVESKGLPQSYQGMSKAEVGRTQKASCPHPPCTCHWPEVSGCECGRGGCTP